MDYGVNKNTTILSTRPLRLTMPPERLAEKATINSEHSTANIGPMEKPPITFIINSNTYSLRADNTEAIRNIPTADRQQLIAFLEVVKREDQQIQAVIQQRVNKVKITSQTAHFNVANKPDNKTTTPARLGRGDVDDLMAKLIMEEKQNQKPGPTKEGIYKWMGGIIVVIVLLVLIF